MGVKGNNYPDREPMSWLAAIISAIWLVMDCIFTFCAICLICLGPFILMCVYAKLEWLLLYIPIVIIAIASDIHRHNS